MKNFEVFDGYSKKGCFQDLFYGDFFKVDGESGIYQKIVGRTLDDTGLCLEVFGPEGFKSGVLHKFPDETAVHVAKIRGHFEVLYDN